MNWHAFGMVFLFATGAFAWISVLIALVHFVEDTDSAWAVLVPAFYLILTIAVIGGLVAK